MSDNNYGVVIQEALSRLPLLQLSPGESLVLNSSMAGAAVNGFGRRFQTLTDRGKKEFL